MNEREKIIRLWFDMWLQKKDLGISKIFTERKIDLSSLNCRVNKQGVATILLTFDVQGKEELASLTAKIRQIESVIDIQRTSG